MLKNKRRQEKDYKEETEWGWDKKIFFVAFYMWAYEVKSLTLSFIQEA